MDRSNQMVTVTSTGLGATVTAEGLIQEICDCEDVELGFLYTGGGGHRGEVVGAGTILGVPFVAHISDRVQSNTDNMPIPMGDGIDDNEGTNHVGFSFLIDTDMDGDLNLVYNTTDANVHSFFSQSERTPAVPALPAGAIWALGVLLAGTGVATVLRRYAIH